MSMMQNIINTHIHIMTEKISNDSLIDEKDKIEIMQEINEIVASYLQKVKAREAQMISDVISVYGQQITETELNDLLKFYNSPTGRRLLELTPLLQREMLAIGANYGKEITLEIEKEEEDKQERQREKKIRERRRKREKQRREGERLSVDMILHPEETHLPS